ncbi:hypothetical protein ALP64_201660 [Pseudomonas syringae pv. actinidiae]|nr:hypothetical protein ALP64_201660 [Pseudomonas syringae pv. actinidiae]
MVQPGGLFATQPFDFFLEALLAVAQAFQWRRHVVLAKGNACAGSVQHADGLVWQLPPGNVPVRKLYGVQNRRIEHLYAVVLFQFARHATEHFHCGGFVRLLDLHPLKAPGQCRVFFEILFIFQPGGGRQGAQFTTRQRWFEQIGGVAATFCAPRADQGVSFVDEQDDRFFSAAYRIDHAFQTLLELALDPGTGLQQAQIQHAQADVLQGRWYVTGSDA